MSQFVQEAPPSHFTELESSCQRLELALEDCDVTDYMAITRSQLNPEGVGLPKEVSIAIGLLSRRDVLEIRLAEARCQSRAKALEMAVDNARQERSTNNSAAKASEPCMGSLREQSNELTRKQRLWRKFRCAPHAYFADSKAPALRVLRFLFRK